MSTSRFFAKRYFANACLGGILSITLCSMGCGGSPKPCNITAVISLNVTPTTASVNHAVASPGNTQAFLAQVGSSACGVTTTALASSNWTASDPSVQLSTSPTTQVTATCTAALASPVTISAVSADGRMLTGRATLSCF
jgi:hypothetical protein